MNKTNSRFICKLLEEIARPGSKQAQMVEDLKDFYCRIGANALQTFESKLREFMEDPDAHLGFVAEATFADWLRRHNIPHYFIARAETPTPDIGATILNEKVYFEIKALQEDRYMSFIEDVLERIEQHSLGCQIKVIPIYITSGKEDLLVAGLVRAIRDALAEGNYSTIHHEVGGSVYVLFNPKGSIPWEPHRFTWPESRTVPSAHGIPFLEYKLEETLKKNIEQFQAYKPTFMVWYTWDQSLWDFETQGNFQTHISHMLEQYGQKELVDVAGIIVAAPRWALFENQSYPEYSELERTGLFDAIRALQ